jgi:hypothetical protein
MENPCRWSKDLAHRIEEFKNLPIGWDGYQGKPITEEYAKTIFRLMEELYLEYVPTPQIVLGSDFVQIEWHQNFWDIEIQLFPDNEINAEGYLKGIENFRVLGSELAKDLLRAMMGHEKDD